MEKKELVLVYDTLLSVPGMHDPVKIDLRISRIMALLLIQAINKGLKSEEQVGDILDMVSPEAKQELQDVSELLRQKAGLEFLYANLEKLAAIQIKQGRPG